MPTDQPGTTLATLSGAGDTAAATYTVRARASTIGQAPQNDIVIDDDTVSSNHARLEYVDGAWRITDLQSRNGTYVEGRRIDPGVPTVVEDGTTVAFGAVRLRFHPHAGVDPSAAPASPTVGGAGGAAPAAGGFRLPVWLFLLILFVVAAVVYLVVNLADTPSAEPAPDTTPALIDPPTNSLAA